MVDVLLQAGANSVTVGDTTEKHRYDKGGLCGPGRGPPSDGPEEGFRGGH